jgi:hypothetical protein
MQKREKREEREKKEKCGKRKKFNENKGRMKKRRRKEEP